MSGGVTQLTQDGPVARVTFSNPAKRNAMSFAMWRTLGDILAGIDEASPTRVVLLRGEGSAAFVSGADISEFESRRSSAEDIAAYDDAVQRAQLGIMRCPCPVIVSIHGLCIGGGMGIAVACDLRYTARDAKFRMPAARLGLGYSAPGLARMIDVLGADVVAEMFFTARVFDGVEAERIGFVQRAFEDAALDAEVERIVAMIVENAPLTIRAAKLGIRSRHSRNAEDAAALERAITRCTSSADYVEGRRAFMEKRTPRFEGR
jgi:enoyl-CoA hydratase/carnithine racemase